MALISQHVCFEFISLYVKAGAYYQEVYRDPRTNSDLISRYFQEKPVYLKYTCTEEPFNTVS